ncbi:MAG: DNA glycosylase AlkZ-like family protein [Longimicrobiales bacterium]
MGDWEIHELEVVLGHEAGTRIALEEARRIWFGAQALPGAAVSPQEAVDAAGYIRTLGGIDVYLALSARVAGLKRETVNRAVAAGDLRVVPTVRGCIYLVDRSEVPWSLRIADLLSRKRRSREYEKSGIRDGELDGLGSSVLDALEGGPLSTNDLRKALGDQPRSLGELGRKVGISSTLPPALRELEFSGRVERTLPGGRLDSERYEWGVATEDPFEGDFTDDPTQIHSHLAKKFFGAIGVGSVDRFASWAGIGKRDARAAADSLGLERIEVEGLEVDFLAAPGALELTGSTGVAFLPFADNLTQLQASVGQLVDRRHHHLPVPTWGPSKGKTLGTAAHMAFRSVVVDGELVAVWEFDPDSGRVVVGRFRPLEARVDKMIAAEAAEVTAFLADELGRATSFSIDTEADLRRRTAQILELAS